MPAYASLHCVTGLTLSPVDATHFFIKYSACPGVWRRNCASAIMEPYNPLLTSDYMLHHAFRRTPFWQVISPRSSMQPDSSTFNYVSLRSCHYGHHRHQPAWPPYSRTPTNGVTYLHTNVLSIPWSRAFRAENFVPQQSGRHAASTSPTTYTTSASLFDGPSKCFLRPVSRS